MPLSQLSVDEKEFSSVLMGIYHLLMELLALQLGYCIKTKVSSYFYQVVAL